MLSSCRSFISCQTIIITIVSIIHPLPEPEGLEHPGGLVADNQHWSQIGPIQDMTEIGTTADAPLTLPFILKKSVCYLVQTLSQREIRTTVTEGWTKFI